MLEIRQLKKTFKSRDNTVHALNNVNFTVQRGEIVALLGSNGAGKTTTMRVIAGLILPDSGMVQIEGCQPDSKNYKKKLGTLLDTARSSSARLSVMENLEYTAALRGLTPKQAKIRALQLIEELNLIEKKDVSSQTLSKGMLSKLALANALMHQPEYIVLDEPTLGLDIEAGDALEERIKAIAREGNAVLLSTHQMEVAQRLADRVLIISNGQIVLDKQKSELLSHFGVQTYRLKFTKAIENLTLEFSHSINGKELTVLLPDSMGIYKLLKVLYPREIVHIERIEADLGTIFRKVISG
ncbi:MAG: ABC transporter ATP-binding protein [Deinococcales bacterium]